MNSEILTPQTILRNLGTSIIPRTVTCHQQVRSTMDIAREQCMVLPDESLPLLVLAEEQDAGRGRLKRIWHAPAGSALLFSLALRPQWLAPVQAPALVWLAGVAVCESIAATTSLTPYLKWPNDVMLFADAAAQKPLTHPAVPTVPAPTIPLASLRKVAGILLETGSSSQHISWAVVGCGINVSASPPTHQTYYPPTHLNALVHNNVSRLALIRALLRRMDEWYVRLQHGDVDYLFAAWRNLLVNLGHYVQIQTHTGIIAGYAEDVEFTGALRVRDDTGMVHTVTSGDIGMV